MRRQQPYGKDVFSACGILVNGTEKSINKANQESIITMAEECYSSMSMICRPARLIYAEYGVPFPLVVAAIWEGLEHNYARGASFARRVMAEGGMPLGWPQTLARWLKAHKPAEGQKWDRTIAYRAILNACQNDAGKWGEDHRLDDEGNVVSKTPKPKEPEPQDAEAHVKSCINRCAALMTELYDVLKQISGTAPETSAGNVCVSR